MDSIGASSHHDENSIPKIIKENQHEDPKDMETDNTSTSTTTTASTSSSEYVNIHTTATLQQTTKILKNNELEHQDFHPNDTKYEIKFDVFISGTPVTTTHQKIQKLKDLFKPLKHLTQNYNLLTPQENSQMYVLHKRMK